MMVEHDVYYIDLPMGNEARFKLDQNLAEDDEIQDHGEFLRVLFG